MDNVNILKASEMLKAGEDILVNITLIDAIAMIHVLDRLLSIDTDEKMKELYSNLKEKLYRDIEKLPRESLKKVGFVD